MKSGNERKDLDKNEATMSKNKSNKSIPRENEVEMFIIIPPDGGWGWVVVFGAFFSYFISDGLLYSFGIFLKDISDSFQCTTSRVSLAGAINSCVFCISGPFSAALVNRYGYRKVSIAGSILATISCLLTSISNSIYLVIVFHGFFGGIGFGMIYITAVIVVGFYFERWRALATGIAVCGAGMGGISLPPILSLLLHEIGWRHTFRVLSCVTLSIMLCGSLFRPIKPTKIVINNELLRKTNDFTHSKRSNYFTKYNNAAYSTVLDRKTSTVTIMEPNKLNKNTSSEIIMTTYPSSSPNTSYKNVKYPEGSSIERSIIYEENEKTERTCCVCCKCRRKTPPFPARPMYRDDIFYSGSIIDLPEYNKSALMSKSKDSNLKSILEYQLSVTRVSTQEDILENYKCKVCPLAIKRTLATMLDFHLLKHPKFIFLIFNGMFSSLGFYTPYMFIKDSAVLNGIDAEMGFWLISTMGFANTFGRIFCGLLTTIPRVQAITLSYCFIFIGGIATILSTLCFTLWMQLFYCAVYGLAMSAMSALRTIIIVEMLGLEMLTNAIGMILMFQGIASLIGITISGQLRDFTGDYTYSFYFGGACISTGAIFLMALHIKTFSDSRKSNR